MSFFSAEATTPRVADLAGLLCGHGRTIVFAKATARLSLAVDASWRANALVRACAERGVAAEVKVCEEVGRPLLRTAFRSDLAPLAAAWTTGSAKSVPRGFGLDGAILRMWVLAAGRWAEGSYLLPLDPEAPDTHEPLVAALTQCGLPAVMHSMGDEGPALRVTGRRRLGRLLELVGPPADQGCADQWPAVSRMRVVS
ncbi:hypothetical protein SAMN05216174_11926 [Actinokineospora iranica]|uniref:Uncharacterized protein n=2 Tax=Actinokineospora iranica TaxID=1271860 RepID=A0A1G6XXV7_9PSEU|nr:hypothetical protein SAMN05216174_11926 [Actinokineospora iranica]